MDWREAEDLREIRYTLGAILKLLEDRLPIYTQATPVFINHKGTVVTNLEDIRNNACIPKVIKEEERVGPKQL